MEKSRTPAQLPYKASHVSVPAFLSISQRKETINETPEAQRCCNICVFSLLTKIKSGPGRRVLKKHEIIFHHKTETGRVVYSRTLPVFLICDDYQQQSDINTKVSCTSQRSSSVWRDDVRTTQRAYRVLKIRKERILLLRPNMTNVSEMCLSHFSKTTT